MKKVVVIGSGFAGISVASYLAKAGHSVIVLEKNDILGGRAGVFSKDGFKFDMGPSWYWMPDVFEKYFADFGKKTSDFYKLIRLDPSYKVIFSDGELDIPADIESLRNLFESIEQGSAQKLDEFLSQAKCKYQVGINDLVFKPGRSILEFLDWRVLSGIFRLDILQSFHSHARKYFKNSKLLQLIEFPVLFLGAVPKNTPALYSLMNYADMKLGTWYPEGGMHEIVKGMVKVAEDLGVKFITGTEVTNLETANNKINKVWVGDRFFEADIVVAGADYHHVEQDLLSEENRNYSKTYWEKRVMAPSALIFYLGINKRIPKLLHHNLFFDRDFGKHASEIYTEKVWPTDPLLYISCPSKTDSTVAPEGSENIFVLIPVAPGLKDNDSTRERYYDNAIARLEKYSGTAIKDHVMFRRSFAQNDFISHFHAFKGNAYGLANTLMQTAILKPSLKNKKLRNLYYTGQLTVPGPGVPPSLISGKVVSGEILKEIG